MVKEHEPSTPAIGGALWKGRLRSHHVEPPSLPLLPSSGRKQNGERDDPSSKKRAALRNSKNTGEPGSQCEGAAENCPLSAPPRRSLRLFGNRPALVDNVCKESKIRGNLRANTPLRRSQRLHSKDKNSNKHLQEKTSYQEQFPLPLKSQGSAHNQNNRNAVTMYQNHENSSKKSQRNITRMENHKDSQKIFRQDSENIPPRTKVPDLSCKKSEKEELNSNCCKKLAKKRKRGTEGRRPSSKRRSHQDCKSSPPECQQIAPSNKPINTNHKKSENNSSCMAQTKFCDDKLMIAERNNEELYVIEREVQQCCGLQDWTEEQDMALRKAYFTARPCPNFWKEVSKMVPGKSAEECLKRVHADLSTPTPVAPRPRPSKMKISPLGHFTLSDLKHPNILEPTIGTRMTAKQKSLAAQKTVRHLLKKQCLTDQTQEADHFSIFETSPTVLPLNISFQDSPGTPESSRKKPLAKLIKHGSINSAEPSPAVLKPVKNAMLHEKYVGRLSRREGNKKPCKNAAGSKTLDSVNTLSGQQAGGLKAARNALISEATDFISHFKKMQANFLAHVVEDNEDSEIDDIECDTSNHCEDK